MSALTLDLPDDVLVRARRVASERQLPLEQIVADAVARFVAEWEDRPYLLARAERGRHVDIKAILAKASDVEPEPGDEIQ